jgi:hypothetical protein
MLEGALILLAGFVVGRFLPGRRRTPKPAPSPKPLCGCGHHRSYHSEGHKCTFNVERYSTARGTYRDTCSCSEYVGPQPLPEYYAPEISG